MVGCLGLVIVASIASFGQREGQAAPLLDETVTVGKEEDYIDSLIELREKTKNPSSFTCDCKLANKAKKFAQQLTAALSGLAQCKQNKGRAGAGETDVTTKFPAKNNRQCSSTKSVVLWPNQSSRGTKHNTRPAFFAGEQIYFVIQGMSVKGNKCKTGGDQFFWGRVYKQGHDASRKWDLLANEGTSVFPLEIEDQGNGRYLCNFRIPLSNSAEGAYMVEVKWDGTLMENAPYPISISVPNVHRPEPAPAPCDRLEHFKYGFWPNAKLHDRTKEMWKPHSCSIRQMTLGQAHTCLKDKNVLFVGDSLNRSHINRFTIVRNCPAAEFWCFVGWLAQDDQFKLYGPLDPGSSSFVQIKTNLNHFQGYDQNYFELFPGFNSSVSYITGWNSAFEFNFPHSVHPTYYTGELARSKFRARSPYFGAAERLELLDAQYNEDKASLQKRVNQADVLVMGVASHDMIANDIHAYKRNLRTALVGIRLTWGFQGRIIWLAATPPVPEKQGQAFEHYKFLQTLAKTREYNAAAAEVMHEHNVEVLDPYWMAQTRPEQSYDGQHYVGSGKTVLDDVVYMNIRAALLHSICK